MTLPEAFLEPRLLTAVVLAALAVGCAAVVFASKLPRLIAVVLLTGLLAGGATAGLNAALPSRAKRIDLEAARTPTAEVVWFGITPGVKLELLLVWAGSSGPRLYWVPWSAELEALLRQADTSAKARGTPLMVKNPFSGLQSAGKQGQPGAPDGGQRTGGEGNADSQGSRGGGQQPTGDNAGAEQRFFAAPSPSLPEKQGFGE